MLEKIFENIPYKKFNIKKDDIKFIKELIKVSIEKWHTFKKYSVSIPLKYNKMIHLKHLRNNQNNQN